VTALGDSSFWLALALPPHVFHAAARRWFDGQAADASVLFCRATQQSFLRLLTTDAVLRAHGLSALTNTAAWAVYDGLLADRRIAFAPEPQAIEAQWRTFAARDMSSPKLWMDAYLAAFALAGGHELITTDKAFKQFKGLKVHVLEKA
jgi:uncharacterized protein